MIEEFFSIYFLPLCYNGSVTSASKAGCLNFIVLRVPRNPLAEERAYSGAICSFCGNFSKVSWATVLPTELY